VLALWTFSALLLAPEIGKIRKSHQNSGETQADKKKTHEIVIATAVCGDRAVEELLVLIKSAMYFSNVTIKFIVFADDSSLEYLQNLTKQSHFKTTYRGKNYKFDLRPIELPDSHLITKEKWVKLMKNYKLCSSQKLFFPVRLKNQTKIIFISSY